MKFDGKIIRVTLCDTCDYIYRGSAYTLAVSGAFTQVYKNGTMINEFKTHEITEIREAYPC